MKRIATLIRVPGCLLAAGSGAGTTSSRVLRFGIRTSVSLLVLAAAQMSSAQADWIKYPENPVGGLPANIFTARVVRTGPSYELWYAAEQGIVAYATSPDGVNWSDHGVVLTPGAPGAWDDDSVGEMFVLKEGLSLYKMCVARQQHSDLERP